MTPIVLVVEEQPALRRSYERFFREEGYRVLATPPSEDALRLVRETPLDLILVDPSAGDGRGMQIATEALRFDPGVRLVFNTSAPCELEMDFSSWVADAYTVRSHRLGDVGEAVRTLLRRAAQSARSPQRVRHSPERARA